MLILIRTINTFYNAYIIALIILNYNNNKTFFNNIKQQYKISKLIINNFILKLLYLKNKIS